MHDPKMKEDRQDRAKFWIAQDLGGVELLSATYIKHIFPRHFHSTYVINVQERGVEEFYCRGASRLSPTGSIVLINPQEVHTGRAATREPWVYRAIYPHPVLLQEIASQCIPRSSSAPYFPSPVVFDRQLAQSLSRLHRILETSHEPLERQTAFVMTLAQLIIRHAENGLAVRSTGGESRAIRIAREYIEAHYTGNPSLKELSGVVGLNPFYLIRVFRKEVGLPPHEYLTQVRVERAKRLLCDGLSIAEVALETGFVDQSHLTRRFKRLVGFTPKQFARQSISYKTSTPRNR
jgi:AraC-like DNA-binding protein